MDRFLTLTRAARLVGVPRGALQKRIKTGELATFEGLVRSDDLLRLYPEARLEDNSVFERFARIKDEAYTRRVRERVLPDASVLAARVTALSREQAELRAQLSRYRSLVDVLEQRLRERASGADAAAAELHAWLRRELRAGAPAVAPLAVEDGVLRIIAAHVRVQPSGHEFFVEGNESILAAALRTGLALPYGCTDGSCGRCRARVVAGDVRAVDGGADASRPEGRDGVRLCLHTAVTDVVLESPEARGPADIERQHLVGWVRSMKRVAEDVMLLGLQTAPANRLRFLAGQSVTLALGERLIRDYPIASCPCEEGGLQFHVRRGTDAFSAHLFDGLRYGDVVSVVGPEGRFVLRAESANPVLFLAWDTGFAPVKGLIEQAMALDAAEAMHLWWGVRTEGGHYLHNLCRAWADAFDNFTYTPAVPSGAPGPGVRKWLASLGTEAAALAAYDAYVAGPAWFLEAVAPELIARGLAPSQLYAGVVD
ncbi:ferredoxin [Sulfurifustis variabilis]|uniref:Ferredoxin n=1 Tax=Sulfurifustis variabilis TaxID=1675686 RepID=A0A1B4V597_9GAMM|nr:2Fe-2S iron-sulfur cluster-binding protein [Sulfurifustis variabilis]BAU48700.1 ferredoxin [Sulfurifustis variabilis]